MYKILLIEDDPVQVEIIRRNLQKEGYKILVAKRGLDGIELARREKPSLILLDMILSGMHGLEVAIKLMEMPETKNIPVVALTGMTLPKFIEECYRVGVKDYLKKPCEPSQLLRTVEKYAGKPKREGVTAVISSVSAAYTQLILQLSKMHLRVESILPSERVLTKLERIKPNLIFLEVPFAEEMEVELVSQLKAHEPLSQVPVILFSLKVSKEELSNLAKKIGADGYLSYPFDSTSLLEMVNRFLLSAE